jgi:hypothetical protein
MSARLPRTATPRTARSIAPTPARSSAPAPALALALALAMTGVGSARAQQADSSARPLPSGLELLHLVPGDQPPLATLDPENFGELRDQFNADSNVARVVLMMSPSCPHCRAGAEAIEQVFQDSASTPVRIYAVWMHVTHGDRQTPNSLVLAEMPDPRTRQYWDPYRLLSKTMLRDYPNDRAMVMADTTGGVPPLFWNLVVMWRPGVTWKDQIPLPDFSGHPMLDHVEEFRRRLGELARLTPARHAP